MSLETYFLILWFFIAAYVVLGLYLHTAKILPRLSETNSHVETPLMPSKQLMQVDEYVAILDANGERPWYYSYLRHIRKISGALLLMLLLFTLKLIGVLE
jgi:hypothetical protein